MPTKREIGTYFEKQACYFLRSQGLQFIESNHLSRFGELDLIMQDKSCLVFIEVRYRKNELYGNAVTTITPEKQRKIILTAYDWMTKQHINSELCEYRFDIFAFTGKEQQWVKNAFSL